MNLIFLILDNKIKFERKKTHIIDKTDSFVKMSLNPS